MKSAPMTRLAVQPVTLIRYTALSLAIVGFILSVVCLCYSDPPSSSVGDGFITVLNQRFPLFPLSES
jgi:hypothetical protein